MKNHLLILDPKRGKKNQPPGIKDAEFKDFQLNSSSFDLETRADFCSEKAAKLQSRRLQDGAGVRSISDDVLLHVSTRRSL